MGEPVLADVPGLPNEQRDRRESLLRIRRMIDAMAERERRDPDDIDLNRRQRIAADSGTEPEEVEQFLEQFKQIRVLMRQLAQMNIWQRMKRLTGFLRNTPSQVEGEE
jgi:signal recognition particle subunit SRP54